MITAIIITLSAFAGYILFAIGFKVGFKVGQVRS